MLASDCFASSLCCLFQLTGQPTYERSVEMANRMARCWLTVDKDSSVVEDGKKERKKEREKRRG